MYECDILVVVQACGPCTLHLFSGFIQLVSVLFYT